MPAPVFTHDMFYFQLGSLYLFRGQVFLMGGACARYIIYILNLAFILHKECIL